MSVIRKNVFETELFRIVYVHWRPRSSACREIECVVADTLVLPVSGVFAKHDGPRHHVVATPSHALLYGVGRPYRHSFPGCIGDKSLALVVAPAAMAKVVSEAVAVEGFNSPSLAPHVLLPPSAIVGRSLLWRRLTSRVADPLEIEELGLDLLVTAARTAYRGRSVTSRARRRTPSSRGARQVEAVKEAIALAPDRRWTLDALAQLVDASPYHLARTFRDVVDSPIHRYVVRTRLVRAVESVLDVGTDLSRIAVEHGFANHSHFTASFRVFFGLTPTELRAGIGPGRFAWRKILTASRAGLDETRRHDQTP